MQHILTHIPYQNTHSFSSIVLDYIDQAPFLRDFYAYPPNIEGIEASIEHRKKYNTPRKTLVQALQKQYKKVEQHSLVTENIQQLLSPNTFSICTAHQPAIFTGRLYFIYKIAHAIKLAQVLSKKIAQYHFVPIYYMGSEDGDIEELGNIFLRSKKHEWKTVQTGAVGRMKTIGLEKLISEITSIFKNEPFIQELEVLFIKAYKEHDTIQDAMFYLVHELFKQYGLVVLIPDNVLLKQAFSPIIEKELTSQFSQTCLKKTITAFPKQYKIQAEGRPINLFYLYDNKRERIEKIQDTYVVEKLGLSWSEEEMILLAHTHPERFSPNVILRPLFQEAILPNIAFIGGGSELAYWLELKNIFDHCEIPYPLLLLRNSFLIVENTWYTNALALLDKPSSLFNSIEEQTSNYVRINSKNDLVLKKAFEQHAQLYNELKQKTDKVDVTLSQHVRALEAKSLKRLELLKQKMLKAEKKHYSDIQNKLVQIRGIVFPNNTLQERVDNIIPYYAKWGSNFIDAIVEHSLTLEQAFSIMSIV